MRFSYFLITAISLCIFGCDNSHSHKYENYDKGYESAWEGGEESSSSRVSKEEKEGYEDGLNDSWMYDEGYCDGSNKGKPKYLDDSFYMDGFKDGKEAK